MPKVRLDSINDGYGGTAIHSRGDQFASPYVFQADGRTSGSVLSVTGLSGLGAHGGAGVEGWGGEAGAGDRPGVEQGVGVRGYGGPPRSRTGTPVAGPGVVGTGGYVRDGSGETPGAGVVGMGSGARARPRLESAGVGVLGVGSGVATSGLSVGGNGVVGHAGSTERGRYGAGVVGVSTGMRPSPEATEAVGVYGTSATGPGVAGVASGGITPDDRGWPGVAGSSGSGPGGEFSSVTGGQVRLVPSPAARLPLVGRRGDLWVHTRPGRQGGSQQAGVTLYFCVRDRGVAEWQRVLLDPVRLAGGTIAP
jgi:hypothetical protein